MLTNRYRYNRRMEGSACMTGLSEEDSGETRRIEFVFEVAGQLKVGLLETPVVPFEGDGLEGVPGVGQANAPDCVTVKVFSAMVIVPSH
jgi:hypothetical protein